MSKLAIKTDDQTLTKVFDEAPYDETVAIGAMLSAIERTRAAVEAETSALRERVAIDLAPYGDGKNHALLELSRAAKRFGERPVPLHIGEHLEDLRDTLEENLNLLGSHLEAVREISDIVSRSMLDADSDGTYSATSEIRERIR